MNDATLIRMANDIARNLAAQGQERAVAATAAHIRDFWDPRMMAGILAPAITGLDPIAAAAIERLRAAAAGSGTMSADWPDGKVE